MIRRTWRNQQLHERGASSARIGAAEGTRSDLEGGNRLFRPRDHGLLARNGRQVILCALDFFGVRRAFACADIQHDLDSQGIAKTAREEKIRARNAEMAKKAGEDAKMAKLYREVILKEKPLEPGFIPVTALGGIAPAPKAASESEKKEVGSFGD